jgi:hypothetical protein
VIEQTLDELRWSSRSEAQDAPGLEPTADCRVLRRWLEQLATALKGSSSRQKAEALALIVQHRDA